MRSKHFLGLCLVMGGLTAASYASTGCIISTATGGGGDGGAGSATTSTSKSTSKAVAVVTSSSGMPAVNPTCETAIDLALDGNDVPGQITKPDDDERWYKFMGTKGDPMIIYTNAKIGLDHFDTTYLDTVVTLYNDCKATAPLAQNDDPYPRSTNDGTLFTTLPADGQYYIKVAECNKLFPGMCAPSSGIIQFDFTIAAGVLNGTAKGNAQEKAEPNNVIADATDMTMQYAPIMMKPPGTYFLTTIFGIFQTATDVDVYKVIIPADINMNLDPTTRSVGYFYPLVSGVAYNGSTSTAGKLSIVDEKDPMKMVASITIDKGDELDRDLSVPLTFGSTYYLFVEHPTGMAGTNDFYFLQHSGDGSNPIETADAANNDIATSEMLTGQANSFFVDGDINVAGDVDHYVFNVPAGLMKNTISVACGSQRNGSGIRGLTVDILKGSPGNASVHKATDDPTKDFVISDIAIPMGETKLFVKMTATSQDPLVTSTFYRCGFHFR